jgi:hypothetical protein
VIAQALAMMLYGAGLHAAAFALWLQPTSGVGIGRAAYTGAVVGAACAAYGVDPLEGVAVAFCESRFVPEARSSAGARCVMQTVAGPGHSWSHAAVRAVPALAWTVPGSAIDGCWRLARWKARYRADYHCHYVDGVRCGSPAGLAREAQVRRLIRAFRAFVGTRLRST